MCGDVWIQFPPVLQVMQKAGQAGRAVRIPARESLCSAPPSVSCARHPAPGGVHTVAECGQVHKPGTEDRAEL